MSIDTSYRVLANASGNQTVLIEDEQLKACYELDIPQGQSIGEAVQAHRDLVATYDRCRALLSPKQPASSTTFWGFLMGCSSAKEPIRAANPTPHEVDIAICGSLEDRLVHQSCFKSLELFLRAESLAKEGQWEEAVKLLKSAEDIAATTQMNARRPLTSVEATALYNTTRAQAILANVPKKDVQK